MAKVLEPVEVASTAAEAVRGKNKGQERLQRFARCRICNSKIFGEAKTLTTQTNRHSKEEIERALAEAEAEKAADGDELSSSRVGVEAARHIVNFCNRS